MEASLPGTAAPPARAAAYGRRGRYLLFAAPALVVTVAVILFPWLFTLYMSLHDWPLVGERSFVGLENYWKLAARQPLPRSSLGTPSTSRRSPSSCR